MVVLIFDTFSGLCNQMYDITNGINFCLKHNIFFTFRYCSFRNDDLTSWTKKPFEELFDVQFLNKYPLYKNYNTMKDDVTPENCENFDSSKRAIQQFDSNLDILQQIIDVNKKYVVLSQFWSLNQFKNMIDGRIFRSLLPSNINMQKYNEVKQQLDKEYNYIHYRYEDDFTSYFNCTVESLDNLLETIPFENNNLKIYVATSNIKNIIDVTKYNNIVYKNEDEMQDLNYEQKGFIDYMIGLKSKESYGHSKSSFSQMIKNIKGNTRFYDTSL